jgi:hypothetical protein
VTNPLPFNSPEPLDREDLVLIVVGAHLLSERFDRPAAYRLCDAMGAWLAERECEAGHPLGIRPLVCTDLWYLNDQTLRECSTVSVGAPAVNALTAYLADKLPSALAIDNVLLVQMDVETSDTLAACWGVDHAQTGRAVDLFCRKYLDMFMHAASYEPGTK